MGFKRFLCLGSGCKFSLEEERTVIELQAQFGNRWARIATYLPGRTDNDVKNFWSSRQKRLARILQTSSTPSKSQKNKQELPVYHDIPTLEVNQTCCYLLSFFYTVNMSYSDLPYIA